MIKKKILLICTGGTIASTLKKDGYAPGLSDSDILDYIPSVRDFCDVDTVQVCNIDSTNMTPGHWSVVVTTIKKNYDEYDGFVILHGTDTMAYTAAALSYMIQNSNKPIVLTGSQKPICLEITDAKTNLMDSIRYACADSSSGVQIVFNHCVIAGTRGKKTHAHSYAAFSSVNFPELASIREDKIFRYIAPIKYEDKVEFTEELHDSIAVLKLIPGTRPEMLEFLFKYYDCLVIEGFGVGGIPETLKDEFYKQMNHWISEGKIVVIATQVVNEGSNMEVYEVGLKVKKDFNLIEAYDMTLEATVTKLMYLMKKNGKDYQAIRTGFYKPINYDIAKPEIS